MRNTALPTYCIFDGLQWESTRGLGRFAAQLRKHLAKMPWSQLLYYRPSWKSSIGRICLSELVEPAWREILNPAIAFYPHNVLPFIRLSRRSIRVLVLHDLLFLESENVSAGNRYRGHKLRSSLAQADLILTVSEASRTEILKHLDRECPVLVIPNALADGFDVVDETSRKTDRRSATVIHFGGHAASKNTRNVLRAVALLNHRGQDVHLNLAAMSRQGELAEKWRQEAQLESRALTVLPAMSDIELRQAYADADVHCMPSTGEGFGIPVIEAARMSTPNVLSPIAVFREIIGENAMFADSMSAEDIATAVLRCLTSDTDEMTQRARRQTDKFLFESVHQTNAVPAMRAIAALADARNGKRDK